MSARKLNRGEGGVRGRVSRRKAEAAGIKNREVEYDDFMVSFVGNMAKSVSCLVNAF